MLLTRLACMYPASAIVNSLVLVSSRCATRKRALKLIHVFEWQVDDSRL